VASSLLEGKKNGESKIDKWQGSTLRRVLISPRIAGLGEHNGEVAGKAVWPAIIDEATHDRLVGLLKDPSRRPVNHGRPRVHPLADLVYCRSCGGRLVSYLQPRQGRGYGCRKDENLVCPGRVRIAAEPLEAYIEGYVIDQWRNPEAIKIAQSDDERMTRIREITDEMRHLQEQKNEALRMKLRGEVDAKTFREVTAEIDAAHDQLAREHNRLASEAAMPELPDPSLAWEDPSAEDRRALTELLVDKIVVAPHPHKIVDGRRHYLIRAIPYQDPQQEAERLRQCTRLGSRSSPGSEQRRHRHRVSPLSRWSRLEPESGSPIWVEEQVGPDQTSGPTRVSPLASSAPAESLRAWGTLRKPIELPRVRRSLSLGRGLSL
jgi:hypothetical protein